MGDISMRDACNIVEGEILSTELLYDPDENSCQTLTTTQTSFLLPDAMTVANTETQNTLVDESLDLCC